MDLKVKKEVYQIQKASLWKRFGAALLDLILIAIVASGIMVVISEIADYDTKQAQLESYYQEYEDTYGVDFNISLEEYEALSASEKELYEEVTKLLNEDDRVVGLYNIIINLMLLMTSIGLLVAVLLIEFIIPLIFKNGQTLGKKCFALCLVKSNSVKVNTFSLFVRSFIGMYTIELMIPLYVFILIMFGGSGGVFLLLALGIILFNLILLIATKDNQFIHDAFAYTVVVDKTVQMIFENDQELIEFKKELHKNEVENNKKY